MVNRFQDAVVAELVDAPDLGSGAARCESSSLSDRTILIKRIHMLLKHIVGYVAQLVRAHHS